jgi:hypothetical protein
MNEFHNHGHWVFRIFHSQQFVRSQLDRFHPFGMGKNICKTAPVTAAACVKCIFTVQSSGSPAWSTMASRVASRSRISSCQSAESAELSALAAVLG